MAVPVVVQLLGEALLDACDRCSAAMAEQTEAAFEWLREHAEPPEGVELRAPDGSIYTGVVIVERSRAVLMLALRHPTFAAEPRPAPSPYQPPPPPVQSSYQQYHGRLWPDGEDDDPRFR